METFKNWQEVLLRREYLRGWKAGWDDACSHECDKDIEGMKAELTVLDALKPCETCGGRNWVVVDTSTKNELGQDAIDCPDCSDTWIAP